MNRDEKLTRLVKEASRNIEGLEWTERVQSQQKKVLAQREVETVDSLHELIAYIREAYCLKGVNANDQRK
jgi:hypothetical protein